MRPTAAQEDVIRRALDDARVAPADIDYIEAHGTGTALGDPIEMAALLAVFGHTRAARAPLLVGSVKTNIGHLEAAAGIAGVIKTALALRHGQIPRHLHLRELNPHIDLDDAPLSIVTEHSEWPGRGQQRLAGVSSFGFGGTNAHVVLAGPPAQADTSSSTRPSWHVLPLSARTDAALAQVARAYQPVLARVAQPGEPDLGDVCATAAAGRSHFERRLALVADTPESMATSLAHELTRLPTANDESGDAGGRPRIAFLFTGQGSQFVDMGRQLYDSQSVFREHIDHCEDILCGHIDIPLRSLLFSDGQRTAATSGSPALVHQTAYTQPALFALEYALARTWRAWGVEPDVVMGHSLGEYVAATIAGVFSLEHGLAVVAERGQLMQALPERGSMAAIRAPRERVERAIEAHRGDIAIAAVNGPRQIVVSGRSEIVDQLVDELAGDGVTATRLATSNAFHSPLVAPMCGEFARVIARAPRSESDIPIISNLTGERAGAQLTEPGYWRRHVLGTVEFAASVATLVRERCDVWLEIGPRPTLLAMARSCQPQATALRLASLEPGQSDERVMLNSLAALYARGVAIGRELYRTEPEFRAQIDSHEREGDQLASFDLSRYLSQATGVTSAPGQSWARAAKLLILNAEVAMWRAWTG